MKTQKNDAAYPLDPNHYEDGLTKREYFAAMALQGIVASKPNVQEADVLSIGKVAVFLADNLIAALNEEAHND